MRVCSIRASPICEDGEVARPRRQASTGDLIRSLALILIPLVVITVLFTRLPRDHPVKVVDWQPVLATAREQSPYPVLAPANLPSEWRATNVSWVKAGDPSPGGQRSVRNFWQLGLLSPDDRTRSLVRVQPTVTTVVVGDTSYTGLEAFAATLSSS